MDHASVSVANRRDVGALTDDEKEALLLTDDKLGDLSTWQKAYACVESGGLGERLLELTTKAVGRKATGLTIVDVLAGILAVCLSNGSPNFTRVAEALHSDMPVHLRQARGITRPWPPATMKGTKRRQCENRAREAVRRRFFALVNEVDAYRGLRHETLDLPEIVEIARKHVAEDPTGEHEDRLRDTLITVLNDILHGALDFVPKSLMEHIGDAVAVDGTFLPTFARSGLRHDPFIKVLRKVREVQNGDDQSDLTDAERDLIAKRLGSKSISRISTDPEAGHYMRRDANGPEYKGFGFEGHLAITRDLDSETGQVRFPSLTVGMSIDTPGFRPGHNAIAALTSYQRWARPNNAAPKIGVFDALYANLGADTFHQPLRELGLGFVGRIGDSRLGRSGVSYEGSTLVEGTWYCAQMPQHLVDASKDRVAGRITEEEYQRRLDQRRTHQNYRINGSALVSEDGTLIAPRFACPKSRPVNPVGCDRKSGPNPPGALVLNIAPISRGEAMPKACVNRTFQIPAQLGLAAEQAFPYMSAEWRAYNDKFRSANEGKNGTAKNPAGQGVGTPGRRRVRGMAANGIITALQLAAENLNAIKRFIQTAEPDADGVPTRSHSRYRLDRLAAKREGREPTSRRKRGKSDLRRAAPVRAASARANRMQT